MIVDNGTIFVTFICNKSAVPDVQPYPQPIMSWSALLYSKVFQGVGSFFNLRENGKSVQSILFNNFICIMFWVFEKESRNYVSC